MPSRPWFKWFEGDYIADTLHLSETQDLIYRRLLGVLWIYGPIPDDATKIAKMCRIDRRKIVNNWATIVPLLSVSNGLVDHPRIAQQREELADISSKRAEAGRKGGQAIASDLLLTPRVRARPDPDPDKPPKKASPKKGSRLPADWTLPDEWRIWASAHLPDADVKIEAEKFKDHWISTTKNPTKVRWDATWRNWIREEVKRRGNGPPANGARGHAQPVWKLTDTELVKLAQAKGIPTKGKSRAELIGALR